MSHDIEGPDWIGDLYLYSRLLNMTDKNVPRPLLSLSGTKTSIRGTEVRLTRFGDEVLDGLASAFPENPIDDWVGGVHVSSLNSSLWFNDNGRIVSGAEI
jgi:hypothetical protein